MKKGICAAVLALAAGIASARPGQIGYDDIAGGKLSARSIGGLRPMADGEHYTTMKDGAVLRWRHADGGLVETLFAPPAGVPEVEGYTMSDAERKVLIDTGRVPI